MYSRVRCLTIAALLALASSGAASQSDSARVTRPSSPPIVVASKPFGESYLLAEMFAQLLEARGFRVERRPGLGSTEIAFEALRTGTIDVYPEYTGTGLLAILNERAVGDPRAVFSRVSAEFRRRFGVRWLPPLGFENTYAIAVRRQAAESLGLRTLTDLARAGPRLRAGFTPDFTGRPDGLPGLARAYGLRLAEVRSLLPAVKYQALAAGEVDVIDGYSTDGLIARYDLTVLEDDREFFPPYEAAALAGARLQARDPAAVAALTELSGRLDVAAMRAWNEKIEVRGEAVADVARGALRALGLNGTDTVARAAADPTRRASLLSYLLERRDDILAMTGRHLVLAGGSLLVAVLIAVPLGVALERVPRGAETVIRAAGVLQTIPGIALLAFMIPALGIGVGPALVALVLYSLYPILRNTLTGVRGADPAAVAAATSLGMTPGQVLRLVRLPLAAPVIMAGVRTAAVINVGTATLAAFIGAGGLGDPIVAGLALADTRMILSGAIPAAILAVLVDGLLALTGRLVRPGGLGDDGE
ncbi:MAG TPA: glycine betaine ABC transporter substrate-binding protein [Gemmatimonadaceae bacterium]|nr:glycine betaine ABC transporter substrate-binding protein [Gemmatimonadaceae bacterium]